MNYTENCHLPQWEEQDRVLRTDFNDAFAALEVIGADHARVRAVEDALIRDAYRREVQGRVCHGPGGTLDGMWVNALTTREDAGGDGHGWNGKYGVCLGTEALPTWEAVVSTAEEEVFISTVPTYTEQSREAAVHFTSDGYGILENVLIWSWINPHYTSQEYTFFITCTRLDTGEVVKKAGPFTSASEKTVYKISWFKVDFPMEPHVSYRMEYSVPDEYSFFGLGSFVLASAVYSNPMNQIVSLAFSERPALNTITKTVRPPENFCGATGIIRWRGEGGVGLLANGEEMAHMRSRTTCNALGKSCMETELQMDRLPEGDITLTLRMDREPGEVSVYDYGLIWQ